MNTSMVYGERIGCTIESSWKLVDCVRKGRSFGELANIEFKPEIGTWPWSPVVQVILSSFINCNFLFLASLRHYSFQGNSMKAIYH